MVKHYPVILRMFIGPDGFRSGWRALLFVLACLLCVFGMRFGMRLLPAGTVPQEIRSGLLLPGPALIWEGAQCVLVVLVTAVFAIGERRRWSAYGLPLRRAFGSLFWIGMAWGLLAMSCEVLLTYAAHGFSFHGFAVSGTEALRYGPEWALTFLFVAGFEEILFRGYLLQTLSRGMGFWPAAVVLSFLFGAVHLQNMNEASFGALQAGLAGFVFCVTVYRTGTLWFAIGFHAAWDFGETFLYSVPDSGLLAKGHLLNTNVHGPWWITGGSVGPEGSIICTAVLLAVLGLVWRVYPAMHHNKVDEDTTERRRHCRNS